MDGNLIGNWIFTGEFFILYLPAAVLIDLANLVFDIWAVTATSLNVSADMNFEQVALGCH